MAQPVAHIRAYKPSDRKLALFMAGKASLELLAAANFKAYTHPITIAIWIALSSVFIQLMNWWPDNQYGWYSYLRPLPAFASVAVPVMFFIDWINRPQFEDHAQEVLRNPDIHDVDSYYKPTSGSAFWILEYGDRFVGLVAVDANNGPQIQEEGKKKIKSGKVTSSPPKTALIRHFFVDDAFRSVGIQDDLLRHAVNQAFRNDQGLQRIEAADSSLIPYIRSSLRASGFELDHFSKTVGILRSKLGVRYLLRENWKEI